MNISAEIRKLREKSLLTQEDFAKALGVSSSTVNRWETSKSRPNMSTMRIIKLFCENHNYPYEIIENEWLSHSK